MLLQHEVQRMTVRLWSSVRGGWGVSLPCLLAWLAGLLAATLTAQAPPQAWHAQWIAAADGPARDYDVVYFRRQLALPAVPQHFLVDVSADTRFTISSSRRNAYSVLVSPAARTSAAIEITNPCC